MVIFLQNNSGVLYGDTRGHSMARAECRNEESLHWCCDILYTHDNIIWIDFDIDLSIAKKHYGGIQRGKGNKYRWGCHSFVINGDGLNGWSH